MAAPANNAALQNALQALNSLTHSDITELRSFRTPPQLVQAVLGTLMLFLGRPQDWTTIKRTLNEPGFLQMLVNYPLNVPPAVIAQAQAAIAANAQLTVDHVRRTSLACAGMMQWILAVIQYNHLVLTQGANAAPAAAPANTPPVTAAPAPAPAPAAAASSAPATAAPAAAAPAAATAAPAANALNLTAAQTAAVTQALNALNTLQKNAISELKMLRAAPAAVEAVMALVMMLLRRATDWATARKALGEQGFLDMLHNYDVNNIPPALAQSVQAALSASGLTHASVTRSSVAAAGLFAWVEAVLQYHGVVQAIGAAPAAALAPAAAPAAPAAAAAAPAAAPAAPAPAAASSAPAPAAPATAPQNALQNALQALSALKPGDITEFRALRTPPPLLAQVLEITLLFLGRPQQDWMSILRTLNEPGFLQTLVNYPINNVPPAVIAQAQAAIAANAQLTVDHVRRVSIAGAGMMQWILAVIHESQSAAPAAATAPAAAGAAPANPSDNNDNDAA
jgi:hypothetical protein